MEPTSHERVASTGQSRQEHGAAAQVAEAPGQGGRSDATRDAGTAGALVATFDELLSILSHELRAPLTTIKGSSRTLLRHGARLDSETTRQLLEDIDAEADRLHRLIDNLLDLSRAGAGPGALRTEPTAVDVLIRQVVADATARAGHRRLRVRVGNNLPRLSVDAVRIEQVLRNLLDNAIKYSPPSGRIDVTASEVPAEPCNEVVIAVTDEGPGIAPEYQERIFERFFRVEPEGQSVSGAGLGLAICRRFVELHHGRIEVASTMGRGATFRFTLPVEPSLHERADS
jgi:two-component system sensor histidine kinase KdpD